MQSAHQVPDQVLALIGINQTLAKMSGELERLAVSASAAATSLFRVDDLGEKLAHRHWMLEAVSGHDRAGGRGHPGYPTYDAPGAPPHYRGPTYDAPGSPPHYSRLVGAGYEAPDPGQLGGPSWSWPGRIHSTGRYDPNAAPWHGALRDRALTQWGEKAGRQIDPLMHLSPEFGAGHAVGQLLQHGGVDPTLIAGLNAHLHGGAQMSREDFGSLMGQAASSSATGHDLHNSHRQNLKDLWDMGQRRHWAGSGREANLPPGAPLPAGPQQAQGLHGVNQELGLFRRGLGEAGALLKDWGKKGLLFGSAAVESASPDTFATLSGSWKLLAASVGETLLPATIQLSQGLQDTAHWFQNLSPETKKTVGNIAAFGIAVAMAGMALKSTGLSGPLASGASHVFSKAPKLAGGGMAAVAAVAAVGELSNYLQQSNFAKDAHARDLGDEYHRNLTEEQVKDSNSWRAANRGTDDPAEKRKRLVESYYANMDLRKEAQARLNHMQGGDTNAVAGMARGLYYSIAGNDEMKKRREEVEDFGKAMAEARGGINILDKKPVGQGAPGQNRNDAATMQAQGLLVAIQSQTQPGYFGVEDIYKKIQLQALTTTPLQEEIRQINMRALDELIKANAHLADLVPGGRAGAPVVGGP